MNDMPNRAYSPQETRRLRADYQRDGWIKLASLLDADELLRINAIIAEAGTREEFRPKTDGIQADQASKEYEHTMRVLRRLWTEYAEIEQLCRRLAPLVGELNGWKSTRLWSDRVFIKPGRTFGSKETIWHQDVKLPFDRRGFATVWIAMMDIPAERGAMTFLNGSHRLGSLGAVSQMGEEPDLSEILMQEDWPLVHGCGSGAPLAAGDATLHMLYTFHRAGKNQTEEDRVALAISYFDAEQLFTGGANPVTDGLGLTPYKQFDHKLFPVMG